MKPDVASNPAPAAIKARGDKIPPSNETSPPPGGREIPPHDSTTPKLHRSTAPKHSPRTPPDQTRLFMNIGAEMNLTPIDIVNAIAGETGLPGKVVGTIDMRERHSFVDVSAEHARAIIAKLNRAQIKGHKTKVKVA
jgi:ATP-dependent RNA helicase DeaD